MYQDHLTKFCVLQPFKSKRPTEVAAPILDLFLFLGAPAILQSDKGPELTAHGISEIKDIWTALFMDHGKARHPQSQGSVERSNGDIKDMSAVWLTDNDKHDLVTDITCVQFQKNSVHHSGIKRSPCSAVFGGGSCGIHSVFSATGSAQ